MALARKSHTLFARCYRLVRRAEQRGFPIPSRHLRGIGIPRYNTAAQAQKCEKCGVASTEPRAFERGEAWIVRYRNAEGGSSTEPRAFERGEAWIVRYRNAEGGSSTEPRAFERGEHRVNICLNPRCYPSTEPRAFERGEAARRANGSAIAITLQRSRALLSAERPPQSRDGIAEGPPSTEPRAFERGESRRPRPVSHASWTFNGAARF